MNIYSYSISQKADYFRYCDRYNYGLYVRNNKCGNNFRKYRMHSYLGMYKNDKYIAKLCLDFSNYCIKRNAYKESEYTDRRLIKLYKRHYHIGVDENGNAKYNSVKDNMPSRTKLVIKIGPSLYMTHR